MEKPESSEIESNPPSSESDGLEDIFLRRASTELSAVSDRGPGATPERPSLSSPSSPKEKDSGVTERGKKREFRATPGQELGIEEDFFQAETPDQPIAKKSKGDSHKRVSLLDRLKKDYRRLGLEVGGIVIMVVAGGYLLWSVYSYLTKPKPPEPGASISKEVAAQTLPRSSSSTPPAAPVAESGKSGDTEGRSSISSSSISKEAAPAPPAPSLPDAPKTPSVQAQEIGNIMTLLENVRQSNLKKDINLFVSCYASDFENMEGRKRGTIAYWEKFNYLDLSYNLKDLSLSVETAKARVEWLIKTSSKGGDQSQQNKSVLDVAFKKEDGRWKIKEVKPAR
jgi:ketosteroid isomerase-like protein